MACTWIYRWGWSTPQILMRLLDRKRPQLATELVKRGYLEKVDVPSGYHHEHHILLLTDRGVRVAEDAIDTSTFNNLFAPQLSEYTLHRSRRVPWQMLDHNAVCQHVLLDEIGSRPQLDSYLTDAECRRRNSYMPPFDGFAFGVADRAIEVELEHKSDIRLRAWMYQRVRYLSLNLEHILHIYTPRNSIMQAIHQYLHDKRRPWAYPVMRAPSGKLWENDRSQERYAIEEVRKRIKVLRLERDDTRISGRLRPPVVPEYADWL